METPWKSGETAPSTAGALSPSKLGLLLLGQVEKGQTCFWGWPSWKVAFHEPTQRCLQRQVKDEGRNKRIRNKNESIRQYAKVWVSFWTYIVMTVVRLRHILIKRTDFGLGHRQTRWANLGAALQKIIEIAGASTRSVPQSISLRSGQSNFSLNREISQFFHHLCQLCQTPCLSVRITVETQPVRAAGDLRNAFLRWGSSWTHIWIAKGDVKYVDARSPPQTN